MESLKFYSVRVNTSPIPGTCLSRLVDGFVCLDKDQAFRILDQHWLAALELQCVPCHRHSEKCHCCAIGFWKLRRMKRITALLIHPIAPSFEGRSASWVRKFPKGTKKTQCREWEKTRLPSFIHILFLEKYRIWPYSTTWFIKMKINPDSLIRVWNLLLTLLINQPSAAKNCE